MLSGSGGICIGTRERKTSRFQLWMAENPGEAPCGGNGYVFVEIGTPSKAVTMVVSYAPGSFTSLHSIC